MEKTFKSTSGTSFQNVTFEASINQLIKILGEPTEEDNTGEDKVNFEWELQTSNGDVFTVYDWKEYRWIDKDEKIEFHLGGRNKFHTLVAKDEIIDNLKTYFSIKIA